MGHSLEDTAPVIDSIAASLRALITFGGPPRVVGQSVEDTGKETAKTPSPATAHDQERPKRAPASGVFITYGGPQGNGALLVSRGFHEKAGLCQEKSLLNCPPFLTAWGRPT